MNEGSTIVSGVAQRYAAALFDLAREEGALDPVERDLQAFGRLIAESPDLKRLIGSPVFSAEEQERAVAAVLRQAGIGGLVEKFVRLVAKNRRLFALPDMIRAYSALLAAHRGEVAAEVSSAQPLTPEQRAALEETLRTKLGEKAVRLTERLDPSLIGGLIVKVGSRMVDASVRTRLNSLKVALEGIR